MLSFPLVSIVLTADCALPMIEQCLQSLVRIEYPKDQLEFFLIIPPERPEPRLPRLTPRLRIIRFDSALTWSSQKARFEGTTLAQGEYVQFLDAHFQIKSDWIKKAVQHFDHHQVFGVSGEIISHDGASYQKFIKPSGRPVSMKSLVISDGLYNLARLRQLIVGEDEFEIFAVSHSSLQEEIMNLHSRMAEAMPIQHSGKLLTGGRFPWRMQRLLTRYFFIRNKV